MNISSYENIIQAPLPIQTSGQHSPSKQTTALAFGSILHTYPMYDLLIKINKLLVYHIALTVQLLKTPNTVFGQKPGKKTKSQEKNKFLNTRFNHQPIKDAKRSIWRGFSISI